MKAINHLYLSVLCTLALLILPVASHSQERPYLLVLGSAHFNNPGRDSINIDVEDVLSEHRQQEIESVVLQLARFRPTHIAIEVNAQYQADLDQRYQQYRNGEYELNRSEADQLGFRLAAHLGHDRLYAVDWNGELPGGDDSDYDWYSYGQTYGHEDALAKIADPENAKSYYVELKDQSVGQWLRQLNSSDALQASHRVYFDIAMIGDGDELIGANWVGTWYARNLKIYSRLANLAMKPDDRVLVIYGQGHAYLLQQLAREHGVFDVVRVEDVLEE